MIHKMLKGLAPVLALAASALVAGCDNVNVTFGDSEGVPLAELDMSGEAPTELVLAGPDRVIVSPGDALDIDVTGDERAVESLRFSLDDGSLAIMREKKGWKDRGMATIRVTLPSLSEIVLAGSGEIEAATLSGQAEVTVAGSGKVAVDEVAAETLDINVVGSGRLRAAGRAERLDLNIAGSGSSDMAGLKVDRADVTVAGSGDAEFASDGKVEANIMGSGSVSVIGRADCTISSMGSGTLRCREARATDGPRPASEQKAPPEAPES